MSDYLEFKEVPFEGKTKRLDVISKSSGECIGRIQWYPGWRQYVFSPAYPTHWSTDCLETIQVKLYDLEKERNPNYGN